MIMDKNVRERGRFAMLLSHYFSLVLIFVLMAPQKAEHGDSTRISGM